MSNQWQRVSDALVQGNKSFPSGDYWNSLFQNEGLGMLVNGRWFLTDSEMLTLRKIVEKETGIDPLLNQLPTDRMSQSASSANEKLAKEPVFARYILVARKCGSIPMRGGVECSTPEGAFLAVLPEMLEISSGQKMIIVENGCAIQQWHQIKVPDEWSDAIWCYRGHGSNAAALKSLLSRCYASQLAWFYDFDPAGMSMSMSQRGSVLVPENAITQTMSCEFLKKYNKPECFVAQSRYKMPKGISDDRAEIWQYMQCNKIAITQESIITSGVKMVFV